MNCRVKMFLDASALVAILADERSGPKIQLALENESGTISCSPLAIYEAVAGYARTKTASGQSHSDRIIIARNAVIEFLTKSDIDIVKIAEEHVALAIAAFAKFGSGSGHAAKLNMGDCFAYAMAKSLKVPLLFIGNDFIHTDIESALSDPRP